MIRDGTSIPVILLEDFCRQIQLLGYIFNYRRSQFAFTFGKPSFSLKELQENPLSAGENGRFEE